MQRISNTMGSRYKSVAGQKAEGATYTPRALANFVGSQIARNSDATSLHKPIRILDPAVGDGELLLSLLECFEQMGVSDIEAHGFDTDAAALGVAAARIRERFPKVSLRFNHNDFLQFVLEHAHPEKCGGLFEPANSPAYDFVIANPPYVRTQIIGAEYAQRLAKHFGLVGRVDLYYAFIIGIAHVLKPGGVGGIIVSNRFMTTKSGGAVRRAIREHFNIRHVWDLGDTKLFDAAVLPAVLLVEKAREPQLSSAGFTSIYTTTGEPTAHATDVIAALDGNGVVATEDGRRFAVRNGWLDASAAAESVWSVATKASDDWLSTVEKCTWRYFANIGKIRVGVKTCADKVFIREDWNAMPDAVRPELLRSLTTHHVARRFRANSARQTRKVLYPHESVDGRSRAIDLATVPKTRAYLEKHRDILERRSYVAEAGRDWYEIWVPQDPAMWTAPKLVFRDISEAPTFWIDLDGTIVNGDCYWLAVRNSADTDLLWLAAAVANSSFIEVFYDHCFNNKLYAGRRRFITQYVERFPLPDPGQPRSRAMIALAKRIYDQVDSADSQTLAIQLDKLVWESFGVAIEKAAG